MVVPPTTVPASVVVRKMMLSPVADSISLPSTVRTKQSAMRMWFVHRLKLLSLIVWHVPPSSMIPVGASLIWQRVMVMRLVNPPPAPGV
jgi:hypothetical protein